MLFHVGKRRLRFDVVGSEVAPVVCMAHALSSDSGMWAEQAPALLEQGFRVLRLDMRGHGGSDPGEGEACTMADLAGDVIAVLDFLSIGKAHFIGLSIGGMIGQQLALDHGARLHSLLLSGTSAQAVPGGAAMWQARFDAIAAAGSLDPIADATMERWLTPAFRPVHPGRWQQVRETVASTTPEGYRQGAAAIVGFDVLDRLPAVRTPCLVLCGDEDTGTPPVGNRAIAAAIPGARYEEITPARHLPNVEHPERFNRLMGDWLAAFRA